MCVVRSIGILACWLTATAAWAQPAFKLGVKPEYPPQATLHLAGNQISRSAVKDDPGFRLQYHLKKDGKTLTIVDARANAVLAVPNKDPGIYSVALELFYPAYKGGNAQKGEFRPIGVLTYLTYVDAAGQPRHLDVGNLRSSLFYGLAGGRQFPVPEVPVTGK
jgi:hypothetical protein